MSVAGGFLGGGLLFLQVIGTLDQVLVHGFGLRQVEMPLERRHAIGDTRAVDDAKEAVVAALNAIDKNLKNLVNL